MGDRAVNLSQKYLMLSRKYFAKHTRAASHRVDDVYLHKAGVNVDQLHPAVALHVLGQHVVDARVSFPQRTFGTTSWQ